VNPASIEPATLQLIRVSDGLKLWAVLRQMLAANPADAQRVAELGLLLPKSERGPFARELLDDPRAEVREALFRGFTPVETDVPGRPLPTLPDPELDELLRRGLGDPSPGVREAAAALTFLAVRGASLVGELTVNLGAPQSGVRWWSILALGSAADPITRALLLDLARGEDLAEASAAIRALAQRRDGRDAWLAGLADPRPDVHNAAIFALATVVTDLADEELVRLAADPRPPLQEALAAYRARTENT
jgi:HEAT repeat protein